MDIAVNKQYRTICFNCYGYKSNCQYIERLIAQNDLIYLSELWLTESEQHLIHNFKQHFHLFFVPAQKGITGRPFGGTALLVRKTKCPKKPIQILEENYATAINIKINNTTSIMLIGVYLQSINNTCSYKDIYNSQLSAITGILKHFENSCDPIILGDFQCCPQTSVSSRLNNPNQLSPLLDNFLEQNELIPIDITEGTGPNHTYQHLSLPNRSYIDHICVPRSLTPSTSNTSVIPPDHLNTGDHLPVVTKLSLEYQEPDQPNIQQEHDFVPPYMWKNQTFLDKYQKLTADSFKHYRFNVDGIESDLEFLNDTLKQNAISAYNELDTDRSFHQIKTKPWWNNELTKKKIILQKMFNHWREKGFPRDDSSVEFNRYKLARKDYRCLIKMCKNQSTAEHYINVEKIKNFNPRSYWRKIRLANSKSQKLYTINNKTTPEDINNEFKSHFDKLLNTPRIQSINNTESNKKLKDILQNLSQARDNDFKVSVSDIRQALKDLNKNKTSDPYGIKAEHFIYAQNDHFLNFIAQLINNIMKTDNLPSSLASSHIVPVAKSLRKPLSDPNNYRGISLMPIITKLIEKVIIIKCPDLKQHRNAQFGFCSDASTIHAELLLRETVAKYNSQGTPVYICSMDAEKAFDCCNWLELFTNLIAKETIPRLVIRFLINLYLKGEAAVKYKGHYSQKFSLTQGVRQGSILSPYLYNIYTEILIDVINKSNLGALLTPDINTSIIVFADDIILVSPTLNHLQQMVDTVVKHGQSKGIKFNSDKRKTQFIISGKQIIPNPSLTLNGETIYPQDNLVHLGFHWSIQSKKITLHKHLENRISELWSVISSLIASGIRKMHPSTIATLFKSLVVPKVLYGLEIVDITETDLQLLNRQFRSALKSLLGLSKHATNELLKYYNLSDFIPMIKYRRINLISQLMKNRVTSAYLLETLSSADRSHSTIQVLFNSCHSANLDVIDVILNNNKKYKSTVINDLDHATKDRFIHLLSNWHIIENRRELKNTLNRNIQNT